MMLYDIPGLVLKIFSSRTQKKEKPIKMICILNKKDIKTPPADDDSEYRPSLHSVILALLELLLASLCFFLALNVMFNTGDEKCGPAENPVSVFVNASDPSVLAGMLAQKSGESNATSLANNNMPKVFIAIDYLDTQMSSLRLGSTFIQMFILASSCVLLGLSLVVMEGGRLLSGISRKHGKVSTTFVDNGVYREICLDLGDVEKDKFEPKY